MSCDDFLVLNPKDRLSQADFFKTPAHFDTALFGIYGELQRIHSGQLIYFTELATDNATISFSSPTTAEDECNRVAFTATNSFTNALWKSCFNIVSRSNVVLLKVGEADLSEEDTKQITGETLFLRAYAYFVMVRLYGDVPLLEDVVFTSPDQIKDYEMTRNPTSEVYDLIERDLIRSSDNLLTIGNIGKSRASVGAAKTLLGKVFLTQGKYTESAAIFNEVINGNNDYSLSSDYGALFSAGNDEYEESIFEVNYLSGNIGEGSRMGTMITPEFINLAVNGLSGSGRMTPTDNILDFYEAGDLRRDVSVLDSVLTVDNVYDPTNAGLKFFDVTTGISNDSGVNHTLLRFADVLLSLAEAQNENGNTDDALANINLVRTRAGLGDLAGLSQAETRLALENERRAEFFLEGHRWFDLVRTNRAQTVLNAFFTSIGSSDSVEDFELLLPIPFSETTISPELTQNPGY
ncbi:MAG: RagB/SusD family nutrient uptake outer membrane protein [Flavobacteriaceae bacterium]|nr:RagB/SusD family nutrient uptake outer membrane protein [Flavobacteriaceae bacterium]